MSQYGQELVHFESDSDDARADDQARTLQLLYVFVTSTSAHADSRARDQHP